MNTIETVGELVVTGPSLTLRYATAADAPRFFELASDQEVTRFFSWTYERVEEAEAWIAGLPAKRGRASCSISWSSTATAARSARPGSPSTRRATGER